MKIGLMGGTFNPIHLAHLRIAEEARDLGMLDQVIFIPAADPPHKPLSGSVSFVQRCEMVKCAITGNPAFGLSDIEGRRAGKSYSIDTIEYFSKHCSDDELYFIIGSDSFFEIGLWHRFTEIFNRCNLIVVERPGLPVPAPYDALPVAIRGEFSYTVAPQTLQHVSGHTIRVLKGCPLDISSTGIRSQIAAGRSITYLVPPDVESYIKNQRIYTECL